LSYTQTITTTQTFTMTSAKYIASKIASDLDQVRLFYGNPTEESISKYSLEAAILMKEKCLKNLEYGFKEVRTIKLFFQSNIRWLLMELLPMTARVEFQVVQMLKIRIFFHF